MVRLSAVKKSPALAREESSGAESYAKVAHNLIDQ